tara:strand:+ start:908 stop:1114 length:207 start_codon:yes stop_codon:yes gene_type:complete
MTNPITPVAVFSAKNYDKTFLSKTSMGTGIELKYFDYIHNAEITRVAKHYKIVSAFVNDDLSRQTLTR